MFLAQESFLLDEGDDTAFAHECRRRVLMSFMDSEIDGQNRHSSP
uniref:Uncharacterized protein n=1 Tax=Streptomyces sp. MMG1612 TaxID=1415547 RepID=U5YR07_9ACTN|nr:hypothetical protein [Streptomyces sp. MMG1612]